ncbi:MAG: hypothetical protein JO187_00130 [Acidobacteria bacterium]|nr:hypothetical protein [Acidobacteriota bacterium]
MSWLRKSYALWLAVVFFMASIPTAEALPAFARKYGLRCSACHEAWPMLNYFGQKFKDNGYQLMNDRDAPIWQNPSYWPVTFRITPQWHRETENRAAFDLASVPGTTQQSGSAERSTLASGFDISGLDFHTGGTLEKNISFYVLPSSDSSGAFHFETVMARLDNLFHSSWLNLKLGKFELDNIISEKRILTISNQGGLYHSYHFIPVGDNNIFGQIGDNQLGLEWLGHSYNDRTRVSAALLSSNDGQPGLNSRNAYSGFFAASQAFDVGRFGVDRVGVWGMAGVAPTYTITASGTPILGGGLGNKGFSRYGFNGLFYFGKLDFLTFYEHGSDSAFFGTSTPATQALPDGARSPVWNGGFIETHFVWNPQLILIQRSEWIRMSQQALATNPSNLGDTDAYTFGFRWYPIMTSRAGFAWHNEYSWVRVRGGASISGLDFKGSSLMSGFDFDF